MNSLTRQSIKAKQEILAKLKNIFTDYDGIHSVFLVGSMSKGNMTCFSDIDMWIILSEESVLNKIIKELNTLFLQAGEVTDIYRATAHHYFVVYKNGVQIDLNLASASTYYSLSANIDKTILYDSRLAYAEKDIATIQAYEESINKLLLVGFTTLERAMSKFLKEDYFVVLRFIDSIRNSAILPLLPFIEQEKIPNAVSLNVANLSPEIRGLFIRTYAQPTEESCHDALCATLSILDTLSERLDVHMFESKSDVIRLTLEEH